MVERRGEKGMELRVELELKKPILKSRGAGEMGKRGGSDG